MRSIPLTTRGSAPVHGRLQASGRRVALLAALALPLAAGCESDSLKPAPNEEPGALFWSLDLDHRAVLLSTVAPYDTLALAATPRNSRGEAIAGLPAPTYVSGDVKKVRVSEDGVLQAVETTADPVWVVATLTAGNLRHRDSVMVGVIDSATPIVPETFSAQPVPPDSAKTATPYGLNLFTPTLVPLRVATADGTPIPVLLRDPGGVLPVNFRSSDTTVASVHPFSGEITSLRSGDVTFFASTTAFGALRADTLPYRIGLPLYAGFNIQKVVPPGGTAPVLGIRPTELRVGVGALVQWSDFGDDFANPDRETDVVFAEDGKSSIWSASMFPAAPTFVFPMADYCAAFFADCDSPGDVRISPPALIGLRVFSEPGVYEFHIPRLGASGRVVVVGEE